MNLDIRLLADVLLLSIDVVVIFCGCKITKYFVFFSFFRQMFVISHHNSSKEGEEQDLQRQWSDDKNN